MSETITVEAAKKKINELLDEQLEVICHYVTETVYKAFYDKIVAANQAGRSEGYLEARMVFTTSNRINGGPAYDILAIYKPFLDYKTRRKYDDDEALLGVLKNFVTEYALDVTVGELYFKMFKGKRKTKSGIKLYDKIRSVLNRFGYSGINVKIRPFIDTGLDVTFSCYGNFSVK